MTFGPYPRRRWLPRHRVVTVGTFRISPPVVSEIISGRNGGVARRREVHCSSRVTGRGDLPGGDKRQPRQPRPESLSKRRAEAAPRVGTWKGLSMSDRILGVASVGFRIGKKRKKVSQTVRTWGLRCTQVVKTERKVDDAIDELRRAVAGFRPGRERLASTSRGMVAEAKRTTEARRRPSPKQAWTI